MSPYEYKLLVNDFTEALEKRCELEGITIEVVENPMLNMQFGRDCTFYKLQNELYYLKHDGNKPSWGFIGVVGGR